MKAFTALFQALDATTSTQAKLAAVQAWLEAVPAADAAWGVFFLTGQKLPQRVPVAELKALAASEARIPAWLFDESYEAVGDLAETIALLLPAPQQPQAVPLHQLVEGQLLGLRALDPASRAAVVRQVWCSLPSEQRLVWNKLVTGAFRVGVSRQLVLRALAAVTGLEVGTLAHRLMGGWKPSPTAWQSLIATDQSDARTGRPYPFCLAHPLEQPVAQLGPREAWQAEWKWDGIRAQLVCRGGTVQLWSRGDELISETFPELVAAGRHAFAEDLVLDGEVLVWRDGRPAGFGELQKRLGRKQVSPRLQASLPVVLLVYDLLERAGEDLRAQPLAVRRAALEQLMRDVVLPVSPLQLAPVLAAPDWPGLAAAREQSRAEGVEGLMLKRLDSPYAVGRARGDWWKWKVVPYTVDAVLVYAQRGHGRRANLYTDYTFAVWQGDALVPFAKAYSGLSDAEMREVDAFIRANTLERFGPVRTVAPGLVFEIAFEGLQLSTRHKSGIAVRFPRMVRLRRDKPPAEADRLEDIRAMLARTAC